MKKLHVLLLLCITALCNLELKAHNPADFEYDGLWYRIVSIEDRTVEFTVHQTNDVMRLSCKAYSLSSKYLSSLNP